MIKNLGKTNLVGLIVGCLGVLLFAALIFPVFYQQHGKQRTPCLSRIKQMNISFEFYSNDHDERMPLATSWMDSIQPFIKSSNVLTDAEYVKTGQYGYAFRDKASALHVPAVTSPSRFAVIYDSSQLQRNAHDEMTSLPKPGRHSGHNFVGYIDGHARAERMP